MSRREEDIALLRALVAAPFLEMAEGEKPPEGREHVAFTGIMRLLDEGRGFLRRQEQLTAPQRSWAQAVHERAIGPVYENLFSSGRAVIGTYGKSATPKVLQGALPKQPPRKFEKK